MPLLVASLTKPIIPIPITRDTISRKGLKLKCHWVGNILCWFICEQIQQIKIFLYSIPHVILQPYTPSCNEKESLLQAMSLPLFKVFAHFGSLGAIPLMTFTSICKGIYPILTLERRTTTWALETVHVFFFSFFVHEWDGQCCSEGMSIAHRTAIKDKPNLASILSCCLPAWCRPWLLYGLRNKRRC